jgi:hypothetical protein
MGTIKDEYYHLVASDDSDDSDDNGLKYGYQSPIRYCHRIAPRHCPVGSLASKPHPHPRPLHVDPAKALHPEPRSRHVGVPPYLFRHLDRACSVACLLTSLACNTLTPLKQPTRTDHGTTPTAKTPSEFLSQSRSNRGVERGFATLRPPR